MNVRRRLWLGMAGVLALAAHADSPPANATEPAKILAPPPGKPPARLQQPSDDLLPIVEACVDAEGRLLEARIFRSSTYPEVDAAALKIARANTYAPRKDKMGNTMPTSCVRFKVKFELKGDPAPATPAPAGTN